MLSKEYGKNISFKDDQLFDKIAELSSPEIRQFFTKYVEGVEELPMDKLFAKVGVTYKKDYKLKEISLGGTLLSFNPDTERLYVAETSNMDAFGKALGYKTNDELVSINGVKIDMDKVGVQILEFKKSTVEGDRVEIVVARNEKGVMKNRKLKAKAIFVEKRKKHFIEFNDKATEQQLKMRKSWLGQN